MKFGKQCLKLAIPQRSTLGLLKLNICFVLFFYYFLVTWCLIFEGKVHILVYTRLHWKSVSWNSHLLRQIWSQFPCPYMKGKNILNYIDIFHIFCGTKLEPKNFFNKKYCIILYFFSLYYTKESCLHLLVHFYCSTGIVWRNIIKNSIWETFSIHFSI